MSRTAEKAEMLRSEGLVKGPKRAEKAPTAPC
jgi:hypothetical protein